MSGVALLTADGKSLLLESRERMSTCVAFLPLPATTAEEEDAMVKILFKYLSVRSHFLPPPLSEMLMLWFFLPPLSALPLPNLLGDLKEGDCAKAT